MALPTGNLLKAGRALAGLTAAQLARLAGIDASTISRLESAGHRTVRGYASTVEAVTKALQKRGVEIGIDGVQFVKKQR